VTKGPFPGENGTRLCHIGDMRSILIIVPEEGLLFESAGIADIFHEANLALGEDSPHPRYRLTLATSLRDRVVHGRSGLNLLADAAGDLSPGGRAGHHHRHGKGRRRGRADAVADLLKRPPPTPAHVSCAPARSSGPGGPADSRRATTHRKASLSSGRALRRPAEKYAIYVQDGPDLDLRRPSRAFENLALALRSRPRSAVGGSGAAAW
jgi:hypothetical protein